MGAKGRQILTLLELHEAVCAKRAVTCPDTVWAKRTPAAFMMQLSGEVLLRLFGRGLYIYEKDAPDA